MPTLVSMNKLKCPKLEKPNLEKSSVKSIISGEFT